MRVRHALAVALVALAAMAGCGDDSPESNGVESKSATQIVADAAAALSKVKSFRAEATQGDSTKVVADVELPAKLRIAIREGVASASLIAVDGSLYIKANEAYWKGQRVGRAAPELAGKWLKSPTTTAELRDLTKGLDPETLSRCLAKEHGTLAKGGTETVEGEKTVVVLDKGDRPGTNAGKLYVATTGEPFPLRTIATGDERPGGKQDPQCNESDRRTRAGDEVKLSRYNESLDVKAPPGAIDLEGAGTAS
jgi:hypothetical protein